jgi:hypothetical protein
MTKTINTRLAALERQADKPDYSRHEYAVNITWGDDSTATYTKDGKPISRAQYEREAPKDMEIVLSWGPPIPPRESEVTT